MKFPQHRFKTTRLAFVVALFIGAGVVVPEGLPLSPAVAQTLDARRAEARRLFDLGLQQTGGALEPLKDLPGAQKEAAEIASLFKTQYLTGNQATKSVVLKQMPQARLIHLATHGLLDDFKGLGIPGAIALAPAGQDNGLLTADELLNLKLNAELAVLSACDTGRGRITGDGVIGLSRSLISAGVPSVIVSLWAVPDAPTAFLMKQFYVNLQQNPDKA